MKRILRTTTLLIAVTSLTGCGQILSLPGRILNIPGKLLGKNEKDKEKALEQQVAKNDAKTPASTESLGEVSYVDEESGFILIRQSTGRKIPASTPLLAKNPTGTITARLLASPAAKGSFIAADIVSGTPERGNPILMDADAAAKSGEQSALVASATKAADGKEAAATAPARQAPKLETLLPPLEPLAPPSGDIEAPPLPSLEQ
jgi:predicted small lipoprotein YifL